MVKHSRRLYPFMDNNDLIIVLGGGFIVLVASLLYFNRMQYEAMYNRYIKSAMSAEATDSPAKVSEYIVEMTDNGLSDPQITIPKDSAIRFVNRTDMPYTFQASDQSFETKTLQQGESDVVMFQTAGTVSYSLKEQPSTRGTVKVLN